MSKYAFNVLGSSISKDALSFCELIDVKGCVIGINPSAITQGEMEALASDKGEWILVDTAYLSCGLIDDASDVDALAKYLKKGWGRKVIVLIARPSAYRKGESALYPLSACHDPLMETLAAKLAGVSKAYVVTLPFDCVSRDCKPYHYVPCISEYIASVVSVIVEKYDRAAIDALAMKCASEIDDMIQDTEAGTRALRQAYLEALSEANRIEACSACMELACRGDLTAASQSERAFAIALRKGADVETRLKWTRALSDAGILWAKHALFNILWRQHTKEADEEMVRVICKPAKEGEGTSMKLLARAYREGRGVEKDLDKAQEWARKAVASRAPLARNELFDVLSKIDTPESRVEMVKVIKVPASIGEPGAMYRLGCAYRDGRGVKKNPEKAEELISRAAQKDPAFKKGLESLDKQE